MPDLFEENLPLVNAVINTVFPAYKRDEDIKQIASIALWRASQNYNEDKASFKTYASTYIRHAILDEIRKRKNIPHPEQYPDTETSEENNPGKTMLIEMLIKELPEEEYTVITLLAAGYSQIEIAKILNWTDNYVNNNYKIQQIRKHAQEKIGNIHDL